MVIRIYRSHLKALLGASGNVLLALGGAVLLFCIWSYALVAFYQERENAQFSQELLMPRERTAVDSSIEQGAPFGRLEIPRLGVQAMVVEGVIPRDLKLALGHVPGTALPGQYGNAAIAGHRDTLFRKLGGVRRDDAITLTTLRGVYRYKVEWTRVVEPSSVEVLEGSGGQELTLVTCYPFSYLGPAPLRFIVHARALETF